MDGQSNKMQKLLERTQKMKCARRINLRCQFALLKLQRGWKHKSINEIEQMLHATKKRTSPPERKNLSVVTERAPSPLVEDGPQSPATAEAAETMLMFMFNPPSFLSGK
jgi:hypothetical protein